MNAIVHKACGTFADSTSQAGLDPAGETVRLRRREHLNLDDGAGWVVTVLSGSAWITQDGDIRDVVLEAGQSFVLDRDGPAIISPFSDACVRLSCVELTQARRPSLLHRLFADPARASFA